MKTIKAFLDVCAFLTRLLMKWLRRGLVVLLFTWLILSHTVGWAADLTSAIFRTGFAVVTTTALAQSRTRTVRARVTALETNLATERARSTRLSADLNDSRLRATSLNTELVQTRARLGAYVDAHGTAARNLANARLNSNRLQGQLDDAGRTIARLQVPEARHVVLRGRQMTVTQAVRQQTSVVRGRINRVAQTNLSSVFGESIPVYGIGIVVGATSLELAAACANMNDLYDLQVALDPESAVPDDRDEVCGLQVPTRAEIWAALQAAPGEIWNSSTSTLVGMRGAYSEYALPDLADLPVPDFSPGFMRQWDLSPGFMRRWFE